LESGVLAKAVEIAQEAGAVLANYYERRVAFESKGEFDLITEADRASEKLIVERLRSHFPSHGIVAEEGGGHTSPSEYTWFVDPLDGTTNFAHSFPIFNVTLGVARGEEMIAGVVFDPMKNELFTAERGGGAYLNNRRIHVSNAKRLADSLSSTGFPSRKRQHNANIYFYYQLAMASHGVRRTGSAAIDIAYVACGRLDFFWEFGLKPWDVAAGSLIVQEAGGRVSDMYGAAHSITKSESFLCDNGALHGEALQIFDEVFRGEMRHPLPVLAAAPGVKSQR
jgi:myo-inositol-1(or 4)-monophosphatase